MSLITPGFTPVSQTDKRWGNETLGFSTIKIKDQGCALVALTNWLNLVFGYKLTPPQVNDRLKNQPEGKKGFIGASMYWKNVPFAFPETKFVFRDWNYNNPLVAFWVYIRRIPVIVAVKTSFYPQHFVLYVGDQLMVDSQDGKVKSTNAYPTRLGSVRFDKA